MGLLLSRQVEVGSDWTALLAGGVFIGVGAGLVNPSVAGVAVGTAPVAKSGMASGLNGTFRLLGVAVGVAALGAIVESEVSSSLSATLGSAPHGLVDLVATGNVSAAAAGVPAGADPQAVFAAAEQAFVTGLDTIFLVGALVAFAGAVLALALVRQSDLVVQPGAAPESATAAA